MEYLEKIDRNGFKNGYKGFFIVLEGCEGAGKSSLAATLQRGLEEKYGDNVNIILTREPGGTKVGEDIRSVIMKHDDLSPSTETLLMRAARDDHMNKVIIPALENGDIVICDRYVYSNMVYQGYLNGNDEDYDSREFNAQQVFFENFEQFIQPDILFYLDIAPEEGLARIQQNQRDVNRFDTVDLTTHHKVREGFQYILSQEECTPLGVTLDARKSQQELLEFALVNVKMGLSLKEESLQEKQ